MPWSWVWWVCLGASLAAAQESFDARTQQRYQKELAPGRPVASRLEALADVAFYDDEDAAEFLLDEARRTLEYVAELEVRRAENDERIRVGSEQGEGMTAGGALDPALAVGGSVRLGDPFPVAADDLLGERQDRRWHPL